MGDSWPQIPQCTSPISHNAPYCSRNVHMCAHFCYSMVHCAIFVLCSVGYIRWVYCCCDLSNELIVVIHIDVFSLDETISPSSISSLYTGFKLGRHCACRWLGTEQCHAISRYSTDKNLWMFRPVAMSDFESISWSNNIFKMSQQISWNITAVWGLDTSLCLQARGK